MADMTLEEYNALSETYAAELPALGDGPGFFTSLRERQLITELLDSEIAHAVISKAEILHESPTELIQRALRRELFAGAA
jgi:hypothetical protein